MFLVEHLLGVGLPTVKHKLISQYVGFFQNLRRSASWEVRLLSQIVSRDAQSVTGKNLLNIKVDYKLDPWCMSVERFKLADVRKPTPAMDEWRTGLLQKLLGQRQVRGQSECPPVPGAGAPAHH